MQLVQTFARVKVSLKDVSLKLRKKTATPIMEAETQNKHSEKWKLRKEIRNIRKTLKRGLILIISNRIFHQLNVAVANIKRNYLVYQNKKS